MSSDVATQVGRWTATVTDLERAAQSSHSALEKLEAQRQGRLLAARTGDKDAQAEITRIDKELSGTTRDARDDQEALAQAQAKLHELKIAHAKAVRERERGRIRKILESEASGDLEREIVRLVRELDAALERWVLRRHERNNELAKFAPKLRDCVGSLLPIDTAPVLLYGQMNRDEVLSEFIEAPKRRSQQTIEALEASE